MAPLLKIGNSLPQLGREFRRDTETIDASDPSLRQDGR